MLHVVEHKERCAIAQMIPQGVAQRPVAFLTGANDLGDRGQDQTRLAGRGEIDERGAVLQFVDQLVSRLDRQPGFADPAGSEQRHQADIGPPEQVEQLLGFALAPDERGKRGGNTAKFGHRHLNGFNPERRHWQGIELGDERFGLGAWLVAEILLQCLAQHAVLAPGEVGLASACVGPDQCLMSGLVGRVIDDQRFEYGDRCQRLTGSKVESSQIERRPFAGAAQRFTPGKEPFGIEVVAEQVAAIV